MKNLTPAQEAQETTVFFIEKERIEETNLYDFIMLSQDETTTPRGVGPKLFIDKYEEIVYINTLDNTVIDEFDYDDLDDRFRVNYQMETKEQYKVLEWHPNGKSHPVSFDWGSEEDAINLIYESVRDYDFQGECNRRTDYYLSYDDAFDQLIEELVDIWKCSEETAKHVYRKILKVDEIRAERKRKQEEERKLWLESTAALTKENVIDFVNSNREMVQTLVEELNFLKENNRASEWQIKANALVQKVSKNDFRALKWKEIYDLIKISIKNNND